MIVYFDTSSFVSLLLEETGSAASERLWNDADIVVTTRLLYVETAAALAQAARMQRVSKAQHGKLMKLLGETWKEFHVLEIDQELVERAAELADKFALGGYDAVHCAAAERIDDEEVVVTSGDEKLLKAWRFLGVQTVVL